MRFVACFALFSLLAVGCSIGDSGAPPEPIAEAAAPIVGGTDDASNSSTVYVSGPSQACSGALIRVDNDLGFVLTAASCKGMANIVYLPAGVTSYTDPMAKTFAVTQDTADPNGHDLRVLQFKGATADMIVTPAAYGADGLLPGTMVDLSGFGLSAASAPQSTLRRHVSVPITQLDDQTFSYDQSSGAGQCVGDEGGPAYATVSGTKFVVGIMSSSDPTCAGKNVSSRVQSDYGSFIDGAIGGVFCNSSNNAGGNDSCYGDEVACQDDPSCVTLRSCLGQCSSPDSSCGAACAVHATPAATNEFNALTDCQCQPILVGCPAKTCPHVPAGGARGTSGSCSFAAFDAAAQLSTLPLLAGLAMMVRRRRRRAARP